MTSSTDRIQEHYGPHRHSNLSIVTQQQIPWVNHQYTQRPVQLKDLKKYTGREQDQELGCLSSFECSSGDELRSLWSRIRTFRNKGRRKRIEAARQRRKQLEDAGRSAQEVFPKSSATSVPIPGHFAGPPQQQSTAHMHPGSILPQSSKASKPVGGITVASQYVVPRKSVFKYKNAQRAIPRHPMKVKQLSIHHKSVHLLRTESNNYRVPGEPKSPEIHTSSRVTQFGDFILQETLIAQPPQSSMPSFQAHETATKSIPSQQAYRGTRWNFTNASGLSSPNIILPKTISKIQLPENQVSHGDCSMCGTPNSPGTRYGDQGLWLCTACRSPRSAIELPPRTTSRQNFEHQRQRSPLPAAADIHNTRNETESCEFCHTTLPPIERDGMLLCSWCCKHLEFPSSLAQDPPHNTPRLTLLRVRRQQSVSSVNTQEAEEEWQDFDIDLSHGIKSMTLSPKASHEGLSKKTGIHNHHWQEVGREFTPTPPLKDSIYLSKKAYSPGIPSNFPPSPPAKDDITHQPPPRSRQPPPQPIRTTARHHLYPPSPLTTPPPHHPHPNPTPQTQTQRQTRARKVSSVYPPTPHFSPSNFPDPPPSISQEEPNMAPRRGPARGVAARASSVYTVHDVDPIPIPRLRTPDWQLKSPNRDTGFYGFWETILRDDGVVFRDV